MVLCDENRRFSKRVRKSYFVLFYESRTDRLQLLAPGAAPKSLIEELIGLSALAVAPNSLLTR
jgi:hypothetical protein